MQSGSRHVRGRATPRRVASVCSLSAAAGTHADAGSALTSGLFASKRRNATGSPVGRSRRLMVGLDCPLRGLCVGLSRREAKRKRLRRGSQATPAATANQGFKALLGSTLSIYLQVSVCVEARCRFASGNAVAGRSHLTQSGTGLAQACGARFAAQRKNRPADASPDRGRRTSFVTLFAEASTALRREHPPEEGISRAGERAHPRASEPVAHSILFRRPRTRPEDLLGDTRIAGQVTGVGALGLLVYFATKEEKHADADASSGACLSATLASMGATTPSPKPPRRTPGSARRWQIARSDASR